MFPVSILLIQHSQGLRVRLPEWTILLCVNIAFKFAANCNAEKCLFGFGLRQIWIEDILGNARLDQTVSDRLDRFLLPSASQ